MLERATAVAGLVAPKGAPPASAAAGPSYKFVEVVRGKAARDALDGVSCHQCAQFYAALRSWDMEDDAAVAPGQGDGGRVQPILPPCGHVRSQLQSGSVRRKGDRQAVKAAAVTDHGRRQLVPGDVDDLSLIHISEPTRPY